MTAQELRAKIGTEMGLGGWFSSFTGTAAEYADLDLDQQIELVNRMRAYIRAHPAEFTSTQVTVANSGGGADLSAPSAYTLGDAASDFFGEVANQAQEINPLSSANRGAFAAVLVVVAVVGVAAFAFAKGGGKIPLPKK